MEPQLPNSRAGTTFYAIPFARQDTSRLRFISLQDGTTFKYNGGTILSSITKTDSIFNKGMIFETSIGSPTRIDASKPVIGIQLAYSENLTKYDTAIVRKDLPTLHDSIAYGDPMMVTLYPITEYRRALQWISPLLDQRPARTGTHPLSFFWEHYVMITAPVEARGHIKLDGNAIDLPLNFPDGLYAGAIVHMTPAGHLIESDYPVNAINYGFTWYDSYGQNTAEALRSFGKLSIDTLRFTTCKSPFDTSFVVSNLGNNIFRIDSAVFSGVNGKVIVPGAFPQAYNPAAANNFAFVLSFPQPGVYTGTLRLYTDANNQQVFEIPIIATYDSARISIPGTVDFGVLKSTETSHDTTIAVRNDGLRPLAITAADFAGAGFKVIKPALPDTLAPGETDSLTIRFTPGTGLSEATMKLSGEPCLTGTDVHLRGFKGGGASLLVQRRIDYPSYICSAPATTDSTLLIRSIGDEPVTITSSAINGLNSGDFSLPNGSLAGKQILPGDTLRVIVRFRPTGMGLRQATLDLVTTAANAQNVSISLQGRKDTAFVASSLAAVDFGTLKSCDAPIDTVITLTNGGSVPDTVTAIDLGGSTNYSVSTPLPLIIYPGVAQQIKLTFTPQTNGNFPVTLTATGTPCGSQTQISLSGARLAPSLGADLAEIRFDTTLSCDLKPLTRKVIITNTGQLVDTVTALTFAGSSGFSTQKSFPIVLLPGQIDSIDVTFTPTVPGDFSGAMSLDWGPCSGSSRVDLLAAVVQPESDFTTSGIDFGPVDLNQSQRRTITLHNSGATPRTINGVDLGPTGELRVTSPTSFPQTIPPGGDLVIEIEYRPEKPGILGVTAVVTITSPCGEQKSFTVRGEGIGEEFIRGSLTLAVPQKSSGMVDQRVKIPISILNSSNMVAVAPTAMRLTLHHNYTLLAPESITTTLAGMSAKVVSDKINGSQRDVVVELSGGTFPAQGEIASLEYRVLLGDAQTTPMTIDSVTLTLPPNHLMTVGTEGGEFDLEGVCLTGGSARLIRLGASTGLKPNHPNPFESGTTIEFETGEASHVRVAVYDGRGVEVARLVDGEMEAGSYSVYFDGGRLPSGLYFCELRSGGITERRPMLLVQ
jgi:hypothetical protein